MRDIQISVDIIPLHITFDVSDSLSRHVSSELVLRSSLPRSASPSRSTELLTGLSVSQSPAVCYLA